MNLTINTGLSGLGEPLTIAAASVAISKLVSKLKPVAKLINGVKKLTSNLNIGGVEEDRFLLRRDEINKIMIDAGYPGWKGEFAHYDIAAAEVPDKLKDRTYQKEFAKMRLWVIGKMNASNPGLGDDFGKVIPEFKMANKGQIYGIYDNIIKDIVTAIPPNTYIPGTLTEVVKIDASTGTTSPAPNDPQSLITQMVNGYKVVKDAAGKVKSIYDAAGRMLNPGSQEYNNIANDPKVVQAGMGNWIGIGIGVAILTALVMGTRESDKDKSK